MQTTVLVTGGCGFIGTWVARELLARGARVVVLDSGPRPVRWERVIGPEAAAIRLVQGSLLERERLGELFDTEGVTHLIHLAALLTPACQQDPWEGCRVNVLGSVALFELARARANRVRGFSYASSVAVFGDEPAGPESGSGSMGQPLTFYGVFKRAVEDIAGQYWRHFGIASVGIRPQVAYGPEREVGLTAGPSLAARAAAEGGECTIPYTGSIGYDYVEDVALAFVRSALETPRGAPVVDLPGEAATGEQVIDAIDAVVPGARARLKVQGPPIPAQTPPCPRSIATLFPDWRTTSLAEGMARTVAFYRCR